MNFVRDSIIKFLRFMQSESQYLFAGAINFLSLPQFTQKKHFPKQKEIGK